MNPQNEHHYLPVNDKAVEWGFYLTSAGRVLDAVAPDLPYGVHPDMYMFDQDPAPRDSATLKSPRESGRILPEFQVAYITDTRAVFESDETGVVEFDGPTLLFLFPGVWHRYRSVGRDKKWLTARWLGFNGDLAYRLMEQQFITPETAVRPAARPRRLAAGSPPTQAQTPLFSPCTPWSCWQAASSPRTMGKMGKMGWWHRCLTLSGPAVTGG